jgi:hypothetical protein
MARLRSAANLLVVVGRREAKLKDSACLRFESSHPSQPVHSLAWAGRVKTQAYSRGLARDKDFPSAYNLDTGEPMLNQPAKRDEILKCWVLSFSPALAGMASRQWRLFVTIVIAAICVTGAITSGSRTTPYRELIGMAAALRNAHHLDTLLSVESVKPT